MLRLEEFWVYPQIQMARNGENKLPLSGILPGRFRHGVLRGPMRGS